jgi:hypothetical protein
MMELEVVQVDKLAAVPPRYVLRFFQIVNLGFRTQVPAIAAVDEY